MNLFRINFELKDIDQVLLWGTYPHQNIHWFGLTDGLLWIDVGKETIYEYAETWGDRLGLPRYNDYQLSRFLEDFSRLFRCVGESIPRELYGQIDHFKAQTEQWRDLYEELPDEEFDKFYFEDYYNLTAWLFSDRTMDSGHLVGGPLISFVRCGDILKIIWSGDYRTEDGNSIWKSPEGMLEIPYQDFVDEVVRFFQSFYAAMDRQVQNAVEKDWGSVSLDKDRLIAENLERREGFDQQIAFLQTEAGHTDWDMVMQLYRRMQEEID